MNIFNFFTGVYRKLLWVVNFIYTYFGPIYKDLVAISKEVSTTDLDDDAKRKAVFQKITDLIQSKGINIPDSVLNTCIEIAWLMIKNKIA